MIGGGQLLYLRADLWRAGERDEIDPGMTGERAACAVTASGHNIDHPCGEAGLLAKLGHSQNTQAGILGRLENHRVAGGKRRPQRAAELLCGIVPGKDMSGDAERLPKHHREVARFVGNDLAMYLVASARVEFEVTGGGFYVTPCLGQRLSGVAGLDFRQLILVLEDQRGETSHHSAPLRWGNLAPRMLEGCASRRYRHIDVARSAASDASDR